MKYAKRSDGLVSRYINRKISGAITEFIISHNLPISPNLVTAISTLIGLLSAPSFIIFPPLGGLLIQLSSILDGVDGELARALNKASKKGGFIDTVLDRIVDAVALYGAWAASSTNSLILWASVTGSLMVSYLHSVIKQFFGIDAYELGVPKFASRDVRLFLLFVGSLFFNYGLKMVLIIIASISFIYVTLLVVKVWRRIE